MSEPYDPKAAATAAKDRVRRMWTDQRFVSWSEMEAVIEAALREAHAAGAAEERETLKRLRAEFDWIWDHHNREQLPEGRAFFMAEYCAALETLILNRLDEAKLARYDCGREGVAGLEMKPDA